jgi:RNA polymerase sigma-70 factor (sigma-E family)
VSGHGVQRDGRAAAGSSSEGSAAVTAETTLEPGALATAPPVEAIDRRAALSDLYRAEYRKLVHLASLLTGSREAAEEVVQDAFVRLDRSWDRVREPAARPAYLRTTVINLSRTGHRRRVLADRHRPASMPDAAAAEHHAMVAEEHREVLAAIRTLPTRQRQCMVLRFYEDFTEAQIAEALGISQGSVKTHLHRAMGAMAERLGGRS